jgi:hypothetical protein
VRNTLTKTFIFLIVSIIFLAGSFRLASACGPFSRYAIFAYNKHPDFPLNKFAGGDIGVLEPTYARSYLFVAYRLIKGVSFNEREQAALSGLWNARLDFNSAEQQEEDTLAVWLAARKKAAGNEDEPKISVYRPKTQNQYDFFLNCHADAFRNAAAILEERIAKFGAQSTEVKEWTQAQDKVFANCTGGQSIPEEASASTPRLIQDDRNYQIAAAHFYAMNFDEARSRFEKIAGDSSSIWREQAQYLVARSLIRKASLGAEANHREALAQAETQLKRVVAETRQSALRQSAQNLLNMVKLRLHPEERIRELAHSLLKKEANEQLKQELLDYTILLDKYLGDADEPLEENAKKAFDAAAKDDLTDWLITYQAETKDSLAHAVEKWEHTTDVTWLLASLSKVKASHAKTTALMAAAERVQASSPAFATVQFHLVRLQLEKGNRAAAKRTLDAILQRRAALPASALNKFLHQRMLLASTLEEFLEYAQRQPAAFSWDEDGREVPIDVKEDDELKAWAGRSLFDDDSTRIFNENFPLAVLREAASSHTLPAHLRRQIALAAWTRAAILDDAGTGKALAPIAAALAPELKTYLDDYLSATTPAARKAAALYTILKFPGLHLTVVPGLDRLTPINERDSYRDNWWCEITERAAVPVDKNGDAEESPAQSSRSASRAIVEPSFLSEAQKASARRERAQLMALGTAPNYLSREAIAWANRTPNDARVPEALHIAVTSTRYGCTDKDTGRWSKAAFQLLHKRYPKSEWAKKTPYWFNPGG